MERSAIPLVPFHIRLIDEATGDCAVVHHGFARQEMMQDHDGYRRALGAPGEEQAPGWALGLRDLYKAVADEPIPSDFSELLMRIERKSAHA